MRTVPRLGAAVAFLGCIVVANYVTTQYGSVPVGFGLTATAGTYFAGLTFVLRDTIQNQSGNWAVVALIVGGGGLSHAVGAPAIAAASAVAFLLSETTDFVVYTPLRRRGYIRAAVASNVVGAVVDTVVFLTIAGFPLRQAFAGQIVGKVLITAAVVALVVAARVVRRREVTA